MTEANDTAGPEDESSVELAYASLALWADDGKLNLDELDTLLHIALRDGVISDREKEVMRGLFNRVHEEDVTADVWDRVQQIRKLYSI